MEIATRRSRVVLEVAVLSLICGVSLVFAGDIVHQDDIAPKRPGCDNNFVLVYFDFSSNLSSQYY